MASKQHCDMPLPHTHNPLMERVYEQAQKIATSNASILLLGPSGSGKQHLSTFIHHHSMRRNCPFIAFNCAGICSTLVKDELFGHEKGSFTGANKTHLGIFERANGGTLLLDEIGDLPLELQGHFLHVLESNEVTRIGGQKPIPIDVRIICATNVDLEKKIQEKVFRADLFYRLNVICLKIPSLSERKEDIISLASDFIRQHSPKDHLPPKLSAKAVKEIKNHNWPGNIRELSNVMLRAVLLNENGIIEPSDLMINHGLSLNDKNHEQTALKNSIDDTKYHALTAALDRNNGNISRAAKELGISRYTFYRQMKVLDIRH